MAEPISIVRPKQLTSKAMPELVKLVNEFRIRYLPEDSLYFSDEELRRFDNMLVALHKGEVIGFMKFHSEKDPKTEKRELVITMNYKKPGVQIKGVSGRMFQHAKQIAADMDCEAVRDWQPTEDGRRFYETQMRRHPGSRRDGSHFVFPLKPGPKRYRRLP